MGQLIDRRGPDLRLVLGAVDNDSVDFNIIRAIILFCREHLTTPPDSAQELHLINPKNWRNGATAATN